MQKQTAKCLITGATGYLGTVLVKTLYDAGYEVTSLSVPGDDVSFVEQYSDVRYADVCDPPSLERCAVGFDIVVHLAGIIDISTRNRARMWNVNVDGTTNIARLCLKHGMRMIYCSSVHAMPCLPKGETMSEISDFDPGRVHGLYGKTKAEATRRVLELAKNGLDATVIFPSGIIGPQERKLSNIGQLIVDFLCGGLTAYVSGGYNFVDVRDVAGGIRGIIENWAPEECYILSGHEVSVAQLLTQIAVASGRKMLRVKLPYWFVLATSYFAEFYYFLMRKKPLFTHYSVTTLHSNCRFSNKKACERIGFRSRPAQESLFEMTHWMMEHFVIRRKNRYVPCAYYN